MTKQEIKNLILDNTHIVSVYTGGGDEPMYLAFEQEVYGREQRYKEEIVDDLLSSFYSAPEKKYTVIYNKTTRKNACSPWFTKTHKAFVECRPEDLKEAVENEIDEDITNVMFIFEGHCVLSQD